MKYTRFTLIIYLVQCLCFTAPSTLSAMDDLPPIYCIDGSPIPFFVVTEISDQCDNNVIQPIEPNDQTCFALSPLPSISLNHEKLLCTESSIIQPSTPQPMSKNRQSDKSQYFVHQTSINRAFHAVKSITIKRATSKHILMTYFEINEPQAGHNIMCHLCENDQMIFTTPEDLQNHLTSCHTTKKTIKKYQKKCPECGGMFHSYYLSKHITDKHFSPQKKK